jgi:Holliday junction DNA helicase RuvA
LIKGNTFQQDALNALVALGISKSVAEYSVNKVLSEQPVETDLEQIIKKALKAI